MRVAGIGCRCGVSPEAVLAAVAATAAGARLDALATVPAKAAEPAITEAARRLGLPLVIAAAPPGDPRFLTHSDASVAATGTPSAAEAAALGAAGPAARLAAPRRITGPVTCAIATEELS